MSKPYIVTPDLFTDQLLMTRSTGIGWDFETLATILTSSGNATRTPGRPEAHVAMREGKVYALSLPGETVEAFCDRMYDRITVHLTYARPPIAESRSLGLFS